MMVIRRGRERNARDGRAPGSGRVCGPVARDEGASTQREGGRVRGERKSDSCETRTRYKRRLTGFNASGPASFVPRRRGIRCEEEGERRATGRVPWGRSMRAGTQGHCEKDAVHEKWGSGR